MCGGGGYEIVELITDHNNSTRFVDNYTNVCFHIEGAISNLVAFWKRAVQKWHNFQRNHPSSCSVYQIWKPFQYIIIQLISLTIHKYLAPEWQKFIVVSSRISQIASIQHEGTGKIARTFYTEISVYERELIYTI